MNNKVIESTIYHDICTNEWAYRGIDANYQAFEGTISENQRDELLKDFGLDHKQIIEHLYAKFHAQASHDRRWGNEPEGYEVIKHSPLPKVKINDEEVKPLNKKLIEINLITKECECGAEKINSKQHADYCPKYKKGVL